MLRLLFILLYAIHNRFQKTLVIKGYPVELMLVAPHRLLKTPRTTRLVNLDEIFLLVHLQKRTDVMGFGHQHAMVARPQT